MAEGTEKSIKEKIEETRMEQALKIEMAAASSTDVWDCHREEHEGITDENIKEHIEECLGEMLNSYISDERNYVVNGAVIRCDQMSDKEIGIRFKNAESNIMLSGSGKEITASYVKPAGIGPKNDEFIYYLIPAHTEDEYIRKLYAVHGSSQSANGIPFATVIDRSFMREVEETKGINRALAEEGKAVSIIGCGNCKILKGTDVKKIAENWESVQKYGTCYLLMKLVSRWINPYCMESVTGECKGKELLLPFSAGEGRVSELAVCNTEHHKTMRFSTAEGEQEGLTMMSTLLCTRGGVITIETPGQVYVEPGVEDIEVVYEFKYDWTKEGLPNSKNITPDFLEKVIDISEKLDISPDDLMAVMAFESWFDPQMKNPNTGAYGLIQFTEISLAEINQKNGTSYTKDDLSNMSILEQLDLVYLHYKPKAGLMHDLGDVYLVTLAPGFVNGEILEDSQPIYLEGTENYRLNAQLDKEGKGYISKGDAAQMVIDRREQYRYEN